PSTQPGPPMTWWQAILLGILQGVTEFLPVSSSGHLVLAQDLLGFPDKNTPHGAALFFDGVLHLGTLVSVLLFFRRDFMGSARSPFRQDTQTTNKTMQAWPATRGDVVRLGILLAIASLPAAFAVFFLGEHIKKSFEHPIPVAWNFLVLGCILYLT